MENRVDPILEAAIQKEIARGKWAVESMVGNMAVLVEVRKPVSRCNMILFGVCYLIFRRWGNKRLVLTLENGKVRRRRR